MTRSTKGGVSPGLMRHAWWVVAIAAIGAFWFATERRIDRVEAMTGSPTWSVDAPARDAKTATGYEKGQRSLVVPGHHNPSFWWIMEAQQSASEGKFRLRHITYDSPPDGRDIERTSPYRWWLILVGWSRSMALGESLGLAIERGVLFADPLLLLLMVTAGALYTRRFMGPVAAAAFAIGGVSIFPLAANFQPGAPDPHSLAWVLALGSLLPLVAAPRKSEAGRARHFAAAGILGGIGFWNDATSQAPVLVAIVVAGVCREFILSSGSKGETSDSADWRTWAIAGASTTLVASVFEFAPGHFSFSLNAVNPIHAVAWWGTGEVMHGVGIWSRKGRLGFDHWNLLTLSCGILASLTWPIISIAQGGASLLAPDFYANEIANHPRGSIAPSFGVWLGRGTDNGAILATLVPCVVLLVIGVMVWLGKLDREQFARHVFAAVAVAVVAVMACIQLRWWNLTDAFLLAAVAGLFVRVPATRIRAWIGIAGVAAMLLPGLIVGFPSSPGLKEPEGLSPLENQALVERDYAYWLVKHSGPDPIVLFSTPIFSEGAAFYGGFDVVTSSDDRNKNGSLAAVRIAGATTEQEVSVLLRSKGVTHLALPLWDPALDQLVRIAMNVPAGRPLPGKAFAVSLRLWDMPVWMRPMDYLIPNEERFRGYDLRAFSVGASEEPDLALSRLADFFLDRGQLREAGELKESLKIYERSAVALGAVARIDLALRDHKALDEAVSDLEPMLLRRSARNLPVDRRISLGLLFFQLKRQELARTQLEQAMGDLDERALRSLTPGGIINLLTLSRILGVSFPSQSFEKLALELIPPAVRAGMAGS